MMKKIWNYLEEIILIPMLTFSALIIFAQVIMRYVFQNALSWTEELARFLYIWEVWLGISFATKIKAHLRITLVFHFIKGRGEFILRLAMNIVWFGFGVFLIYIGAKTTMQIASFGQVSSAISLPMQYVYVAIPVGATLMNIRLAEETVRMFTGKNHGGGEVSQNV